MKKDLVDENGTRHDGSSDTIPNPPNCPLCGQAVVRAKRATNSAIFLLLDKR